MSLIKIVPIREADEEFLRKISAEGLLSLSVEEMRSIQGYFRNEKRDPTDVELETLAQTWSEHCNHKTFRGQFTYAEESLDGEKALASGGPRQYGNLLKDTIVKTTEELNQPWCLSVFKDNAGIIQFDEGDAVAFKVETHNHPSALEPYGGAGTGIGGVIRDILGCGLGGKPVLNTDVFCFGNLDTSVDELPQGVLHPKQIARGVVSGVRDYGNRMGIPTANGAVYFDEGYVGNPLVYCGTVGYMPQSAIAKKVTPGELVVAVGGRTGRDGIHGATFSSAPLQSGITSNVVQIGHAIMEKKTMDVLLCARDKGLYRSVTDCGAGGFSSAVGELGKETGVKVDLKGAPLKYQGLLPWEIWVSESQERMICAVPREKWHAFKTLFDQEDVEAVVLGEFTDDKRLTVTYGNDPAVSLDMGFLHEGCPRLKLNAVWNSQKHREKHGFRPRIETSGATPAGVNKSDLLGTLKALLAHPVIASKEVVVRQYDHEVQGGSVIKPLMGNDGDGPTDACVFRPNLNSWKGVAVSNGLNPQMGKWDPYLMAKYAVDEAYRNVLAVGGGLNRAAILDNFCWGDSRDDYELGGLVRASEGAREAALAYGLPFISGKDSFNNTWKTKEGTLQSIPPTLLVSCIGILEDVRDCITPGLKREGNFLYLIGETKESLKGSLLELLWRKSEDISVIPESLPSNVSIEGLNRESKNVDSCPPQDGFAVANFRRNDGVPVDFDCAAAKAIYGKLKHALKHKLAVSCHDISEGGIAVAGAEMAFGSALGMEIVIPSGVINNAVFLFCETPSRFLVEVTPEAKNEFEITMGARTCQEIGRVIKKPQMVVKNETQNLIQATIPELKEAWQSGLEGL